MSKLSKFKSGILPSEAAKLLSRLICEEVTENDISIMHTGGWLTAKANCFATVVKLVPLLDSDEHEKQVRLGRYFMKPVGDCGLCLSFYTPADQVDLGENGRAYVLRDKDGGFYGLRDHETESFLSDLHDNMPYFEECLISPADIYRLAELANNDLPVQRPEEKILPIEDCVCPVELFNLSPIDDRPSRTAPSDIIQKVQESPSHSLAIAALVELITSGKNKKYNQSSLIEEILDKYDLRGLSKSNLEKMFSQANRKLIEAKAERT